MERKLHFRYQWIEEWPPKMSKLCDSSNFPHSCLEYCISNSIDSIWKKHHFVAHCIMRIFENGKRSLHAL